MNVLFGGRRDEFDVPRGIPQGPGDVNARTGWWSNNNGLGSDQKGAFPRDPGERIQVCGEDAPGPPAPYTVTLHSSYRYRAGANCGMRAYITIGVGGTSKVIVCDFSEGAQLAIAGGGSVGISAVPYAPDPEAAYDAGDSTFHVGASFAPQNGSHPQPRYTQRLARLTNGSSSAIAEPPQWAEAVQLQLLTTSEDLVDPYIAARQLHFVDPAGNTFANIPGNKFPDFWAPIPQSSRVRVSNGSAVTITPTLLWRLAL